MPCIWKVRLDQNPDPFISSYPLKSGSYKTNNIFDNFIFYDYELIKILTVLEKKMIPIQQANNVKFPMCLI